MGQRKFTTYGKNANNDQLEVFNAMVECDSEQTSHTYYKQLT